MDLDLDTCTPEEFQRVLDFIEASAARAEAEGKPSPWIAPDWRQRPKAEVQRLEVNFDIML